MAKVRKAQEELKKGSSDYGFDKLKDGKNVRRILPPKGDKTMFYSEGYVHFGLGPEGKDFATCSSTFGKKCAICEYLDSIKDSKSKEDKEFIQKARKTKRIYLNVLNRDSNDEEEKPVILPVGKMILKQIIDIICDPDYGDITDFESGRDVTITKSGKGMNTEYAVIAKPKETPASEQYSEEELDELLPDLDSLFTEKTEEQLTALLTGEVLDEDDDDEEVDDDEVDDSEEEDDEEELDEKDYDEMELDDLKELCIERGIKLPSKLTKSKLITLLEMDEEEEEEDADDEDDLMASVKNAVKARRAGRK